MRIAYLAAGAAGMYCGSCLHDNRLAAALRAAGRDVVLVPLYTPLRTDERDVSEPRVLLGGLGVYLQHRYSVFRRAPGFVHRLLSARPLLNLVGRLAGATRPESLGELTLATLAGEEGPLRGEVRRLVAALAALRPDVVHLPNLLLAGLAGPLKRALGVPVVCTLAGEDLFVEGLPEPWRGRVLERITARARDIDAFVALTAYYAAHATGYYGLPGERVQRIPMGIHSPAAPAEATGKREQGTGNRERGSGDRERGTEPGAATSAVAIRTRSASEEQPFTIGYLARVCPEKGFDRLARAVLRLRASGRDVRLRAAGWLGRADRAFFERTCAALRAGGVDFEYAGEVTRAQKWRFLDELDAFCVPAVYRESKGFYVLEALAAGLPVVAPAHGSFVELLAPIAVSLAGASGSDRGAAGSDTESPGAADRRPRGADATEAAGVLVAPGDAESLAAGLARVMDDPALRQRLAAAGPAVVAARHRVEQMAEAVWGVYEGVLEEAALPTRQWHTDGASRTHRAP